jgi:chromosome segregation ATPase
MFGQIRLIFTIIIMLGISGAGIYVMKLRADNATLKANQMKLEQAVTSQQQLLEQQKKDFQAIMKANTELNALINNLKKDIDDLDKRFNKNDRDIGKIAIEKPKVIERIVNKGTEAAARCIELASGAPHTEAELKATKKSEINRECPSIANPNYVPYE